MDVRITQLSADRPEDRDAWQDYVRGHAEATVFHTLAWMDAVRRTYAHQPCYLLARRNGRVVGVFPLFAVRSFLAGPIVVSVPYGVYGGVLCDDQPAADALLEAARQSAREHRATYIDVRSQQPRWPDMPTVERYASFCKALPQSPGEVLGSFPRKARAEIRRARTRCGLRVRFDDGQLATVWSLYTQSMRRLGSPNLPYRFFEAVVEATPGAHLVSVVYDADQPIAGLFSLTHRDTVLPYYSGSIHARAAGTGANNLLYASLMERAVELGLRQFDFGRTRLDNRGSFDFKKNQGFKPYILGYQFDVPRGGPLPNLTPSNRRFHLAQQIWRRMPLILTRPLGGWLSASIPG